MKKMSLFLVVALMATIGLHAQLVEGDFEFRLNGVAATITKYNGTATTLTIPDKIGGGKGGNDNRRGSVCRKQDFTERNPAQLGNHNRGQRIR